MSSHDNSENTCKVNNGLDVETMGISSLCKVVITKAGLVYLEDCIIAAILLAKPLMAQPLPKMVALQLKKHIKILEAAARADQSQHTNPGNLEVSIVAINST